MQPTLRASRATGSSSFASVWYPATRAGTDTPLDLSRAPYPVVIFAHGWFQLPEGYKTILEHVTSHGYIVIGSRANKELYGDQFALSLSWCVDFLCDQAAIPASRWHQVPDCHRIGALGHSIGAGAATLAVADDVRFKALVLLWPAEVFPSAVTAAARAHTPLLVLAAPDDLTDGAHKIALPLYEAVHAPMKQLHLLKNGGQFFADGMLLGKRHRKQLRTTALMVHAFFDTYLRARLHGSMKKCAAECRSVAKEWMDCRPPGSPDLHRFNYNVLTPRSPNPRAAGPNASLLAHRVFAPEQPS